MIVFKSSVLRPLEGVAHGFFGRDLSVYKCFEPTLDAAIHKQNQHNLTFAVGSLGVKAPSLFMAKQIHSNTVIRIDDPSGDDYFAGEGDGLVSNKRGVVLGVLTADCAPVLMYDAVHGVIAAAHAGWRGAIAGVVPKTLRAIEEMGGSIKSTHVVIGPLIAQTSYEVGDDVYHKYCMQSPANARFFLESPEGSTFYFDLRGYLTDQIQASRPQSIENIFMDTYKNPELLKSYRRMCHQKNNDIGNNISLIALK